MLKIENLDYWGFEHAVRGMRNPLNSWSKSDSIFEDTTGDYYNIQGDGFPAVVDSSSGEQITSEYILGENDLDLMKRLYAAGPEHRKYLRQIFVSMDITAPFYWWKEFDTYKVGTVANSCSTMHKIAAKEFDLDDFSHDYLNVISETVLKQTISALNLNRDAYLSTKDKAYWWQMIQLLPSSYNQKRTVTMNYENVMTIINQRSGHKLDEWHELIGALRSLPYILQIRGEWNG